MGFEDDLLSGWLVGRSVACTMHDRRVAGLLLACLLLVCSSALAGEPLTAGAAPVSTRAASGPARMEAVEDDSFGDLDRMRGRGALGVSFGVGVLPAPGFGPSAAFGLQWRHFGMAVEGRILFTPDFSIDQDHAAYAMLGLGILGFCYAMDLPRPLRSVEFCPFLGAGRLVVQPVRKENQPDYFTSAAHPFVLMSGVRLPFTWQAAFDALPDLYFKTFVEFDAGLLRNHVSLNNVTIWGDAPPVGFTLGIEASVVVNQPRAWDRPDPAKRAAAGARAERRTW